MVLAWSPDGCQIPLRSVDAAVSVWSRRISDLFIRAIYSSRGFECMKAAMSSAVNLLFGMNEPRCCRCVR